MMNVSRELIEKLEAEERKIPYDTTLDLARHVEIIGGELWIYKNFTQFNMGWVNGYPGKFASISELCDTFQSPSNEVIELTRQQILNYCQARNQAVVDLLTDKYGNINNKEWSNFCEYRRNHKEWHEKQN